MPAGRVLPVLTAALLLFGCASVPNWVEAPPAVSNTEVFFTGLGSDDGGNAAKAEKSAMNSMVSEVTRYLGVRITSESTVEATSTLTTYTAEITELIREASYAYISDLRLVDRYSETLPDGTLIVHLLGAYDRSALAAEKERLARLIAERIEAVAGPERAGDAHAIRGDLYDAAVSYLESASAALDSDIENAALILQRVLGKAVDAVTRITVGPVSAPESARVGMPVTQMFSISAAGPAGVITGVPFSVTWTDGKPGGRGGLMSAIVRTDPAGVAVFSHPPPAVAGIGRVNFSLSFSAQLEPLKSAAGKADELVRGFERAIATKRVEYRFSVLSESMSYETAVYFVDMLDDGTIFSDSATGSGIYASLGKAGFPLVPFTGLEGLHNFDTLQFIDAVRQTELTQAHRVIFGVATVTSISVENDVFLVSAEADLKVVDIETGKIVYTKSGTRTARGRSREAGVAAVFHGLGEQLGEVLARELP
jgi:hypothetical protein